MTSQVSQVTYGNFLPTARTGILGLSLGASLAWAPLIVLVIGLLAQGMHLQAIGVVVVGLVATTLLVTFKIEGRSVYTRAMHRLTHRVSARAGRTKVLGGPVGKLRDGSFTPPGLAAAASLSEHLDAYGNPFGLIHLPVAGHHTVVLEAFPDGDALVDPERIDSMVSQWGGWLSQLGVDEGIVGASVTVETAADPGVRLSRMVERNLDPSAAPFARGVAGELVEHLSTGSPVVITRIAITFSGARLGSRGTDPGPMAMGEDIGNRLPVLLSGLMGTGAGASVRACTSQDIIDFARVAYDPTVSTEIEIARTDAGTGLSWGEAGPVFADERFDCYFHDRAVSRTWQMWRPPSGIFYSSLLRRLLEPTSGVLRKRVTLLYRPIPASEAAGVIESEINNASFSGSEKRRRSAREVQRKAFAEKAAKEEAAGAGLTRFGMLVSVSCASPEDFPRLDKVIPGLGNQARLRLRLALGNQAVAFQAALPLGVVLPEHSMLPATVREFL